MKKYDCDVVKDLLPLYLDEVCSEKTKDMVAEHLLECVECSVELEQLKETLQADPVEVEKEKGGLKNLKKRIFQKKVITTIIGIVCACIVFCGIGGYFLFYETPISYADMKLSVKKDDTGKFQLIAEGTRYSCINSETEYMGEDENNIYKVGVIYCTSTPYNRMTSTFKKYILLTHLGEPYGRSQEDVYDGKGKKTGTVERNLRIVSYYYQEDETKEKHLIWEDESWKNK